MTRQRDTGTDVVRLSNFERAIGAFAMAALGYLLLMTVRNHDDIADLRKDIAVINTHLQINGAPKTAGK